MWNLKVFELIYSCYKNSSLKVRDFCANEVIIEVALALNRRNHRCQMYKDCIRSKIIGKDVKSTGTCPEQQNIYNTVIPKSLCPFGVFWRSLGLWGKKPV